MERIFVTHVRRHSEFAWGRMGDLGQGRPTLGPNADRTTLLSQNATLMKTLSTRCGKRKARELFRQAGRLAGSELALYELELEAEAEAFFAGLARRLWAFGLGPLAHARWNAETGEAVFDLRDGVLEDVAGGTHFAEGLLAGVMEVWIGKTCRCRAGEDGLYHCTTAESETE